MLFMLYLFKVAGYPRIISDRKGRFFRNVKFIIKEHLQDLSERLRSS